VSLRARNREFTDAEIFSSPRDAPRKVSGRFTVVADRLHIVPDDLDDRTAALIAPLSTPVHAVRLAGDTLR